MIESSIDRQSFINKPVTRLSQFSSVLTVVGENKQPGLQGVALFPPEQYPIMWYINLDTNDLGNRIANEMLQMVGDLRGGGADPVRYEEYLGEASRHLYLYFQNMESFNLFTQVFIGDGIVTIAFLDGRLEKHCLSYFQNEARTALEEFAVKPVGV